MAAFASAAGTSQVPTTGTPRQWISDAVQNALVKAFGDDYKNAATMVTAATKPEFGDYQCNAAMPLAKPLRKKPKDIAQALIDNLDTAAFCQTPTIAGPGFINLKLKDDYVTGKLKSMLVDESRLDVPKVAQQQRVIVDFSSPNIAKEMHVGHLRSTIIGDTLCRVLQFLGHDVVRLNHVGDWGTQFGMLITYLKQEVPEALDPATADKVDIGDLVVFYKKAKARFDKDDDFKLRSRQEVVKLQAGDEENIRCWRLLCATSRKEFQVIYDTLDVKLEERGESFYNPLLPAVMSDLKETGLLVESDGAQVVYLDGYTNREGGPQPFLIQKSDGAYLYATTDLAAIRHRVATERADRILYVTDVGQSGHFDQAFQVARKAKFLPPEVELVHVPFGLVQGEDGKKLKTRSGETVRLQDLLDEAVKIAEADMVSRLTEEGRELGEYEKNVARIVGIGAVKYADLSMNRESNYRFSYKKMLSLQGNTAPYMLYAYARIQGIKRKALEGLQDYSDLGDVAISLDTPAEVALSRQLLKLPEVLDEVQSELYPNRLCDYLYDLSARFNQFYETCHVVNAETVELKKSRTALCSITAEVLRLSLGLLGIPVVERL